MNGWILDLKAKKAKKFVKDYRPAAYGIEGLKTIFYPLLAYVLKNDDDRRLCLCGIR